MLSRCAVRYPPSLGLTGATLASISACVKQSGNSKEKEWWVRCDLCHCRVPFLSAQCLLSWGKIVSFSLFLIHWVEIPWWAPGVCQCTSVHRERHTDTHTHRAVELFITFLLLFRNLPVPFVKDLTAELECLMRQLEFGHEVSKQSEQLVHPCAVLAVPCGRQCQEGRSRRLPGRPEPPEPRPGVGTPSRLRAQLCGGRGSAGQAGARGARGLQH